ncbi:Arylsulfatase A [Tenacibaculum sp. MAR_2009_124]|uniref:sulfatase-like hydrolase/transferase n=1 Tax=Tenacibaculum sp. MAR_2009_124 TaxID=1250059 RepID=UPI00089C8DD0|nr:sulfatase-like hydrolase/transferase [Tenacibaculum sp. MAR_2009_124]SEB36914.1 Arylsulfatase A [Tenacibaculum sp. MAR_2009_124]
MQKSTLLIIALFFLISCGNDNGEVSNSTPTPSLEETPNILLIIVDDLGKDALSGYSEGVIKPNTPNLNELRNNGLLFNNFWVYPTCSPTRASIITGKYGYRTGIKWAGDVLSNSETILQKYISNQTNNEYATAVVGKWHLAGGNNRTFNPESLGIDYFAGIISGTSDYYQWELTEDGSVTTQNNYITEKFTDLSIDWIAEQSKPWFLWLAYTAPHTPFHLPPNEMHSQEGLAEYNNGTDVLPYYLAAIEAMDYQIGRLLNSMSSEEKGNTTVIVLGDNGTPNQATQSPYESSKVKGTLYQGGINTPILVSGAGVSRTGSDNSLVSSTDLYTTLAEIAGVSINEINDSKSFKSLFSINNQIREYQYSEMNSDSKDAWCISNGNFKLIVDSNGQEQLYDLMSDPYERSNLMEGTLSENETLEKEKLKAELLKIRN